MDQEITERFLDLEGDVLQLQKERVEDLKLAVSLEDFKRQIANELRALKKEQTKTTAKMGLVLQALRELAKR